MEEARKGKEKEKNKEKEKGVERKRGKEMEKLQLGKLGGMGGEEGRRRIGSIGSWEDFMRGKRKERRRKWKRRGERGLEEGKKEIMGKIEGVREEMERDRKEWRGEIEKLKSRVNVMEGREEEREKTEKDGKEGGKGEKKEIERRLRRLEWEKEKRERESRRNNVVVWGVEKAEGSMEELKKEVEGIMKIVGVEKGVKEVRRMGKREGEGRKGVTVEMEDRESKRKVMEGKHKLRGRKERIEEDLTWKERKVMGIVRRVAEEERRKGRRVNVGYMKVWVEGREWRWDEEREGLWDKEVEGVGCGGMVKTWVEEKGWKGIKGKLPRGYKWWMQRARKEEKRGRAKGGIIIGVRKEMEGRIKGGEEDEEGIMEVERNGRGVEENSGKGTREEGDNRGDWNARTGELGGGEGEHEGMEGERMSRDKVINTEGRRMMNVIGEMGLEIWNGSVKGDEEGEYTYVGEVREELKKMEVEVRTESDHLPMVVTLKRERERRGTKWGERREIGWMKEDRERYRRKTEEMREETEEGVEGRWRRVQEKVKEIEQEVRGRREGGGKERERWWDEECREGKKELRRMMREWLKGKRKKEEYVKERKKYKEKCEEKKGKWREEWYKEIERIKTEGEVWEVVRKVRGREGSRAEEIKIKEWDDYFRRQLEGKEERERGCERKESRGEEKRRGNEIEEREVEREFNRLKPGKAAGENGVGNEVWKYGGKGVRREVWRICNGVWKGEGWPEGWETGIIVPIKKKGEGRKVEEYRGVTLMDTLAKVYAGVLGERQEKEMKEKNMIGEGQTGYRKGRGVMEHIYTLNFLVNREVEEKGGGMVGCFIDLRAAFDTIDRGKLWKELERKGVSRDLREAIEGVYRETACKVKRGKEMGGKFWTEKGVKQGCPMSAKLFILYMAELEERLEKRAKGGIRIGAGKVY
ncbi:golgin subfamily A member 6-like protein 22 [Prorops nasuta]|uniref:golgin subfamily A member 6-like protein 22 n=1 Tax=Prorops nasuta TaxID=863751 RepID=UPI0034CE9DEB